MQYKLQKTHLDDCSFNCHKWKAALSILIFKSSNPTGMTANEKNTFHASRFLRKAIAELSTSFSHLIHHRLIIIFSFHIKDFHSKWKKISGVYGTHERKTYIKREGKRNKQDGNNTCIDTVIMTINIVGRHPSSSHLLLTSITASKVKEMKCLGIARFFTHKVFVQRNKAS